MVDLWFSSFEINLDKSRLYIIPKILLMKTEVDYIHNSIKKMYRDEEDMKKLVPLIKKKLKYITNLHIVVSDTHDTNLLHKKLYGLTG